MKAISIGNIAAGTPSAPYPPIRLYADSAIGRDVMPLFVPDIPLRWTSNVCLAVRILRLGKSISPRYAHRYIDAIGLVNVLAPVIDCPEAQAIDSSGSMSIMDSAITTGRWIECDLSEKTAIDVTVNGSARTLDIGALGIDNRLCAISQLATVKTGDIMILTDTAVSAPLTLGTTIKASINNGECLSLKIR